MSSSDVGNKEENHNEEIMLLSTSKDRSIYVVTENVNSNQHLKPEDRRTDIIMSELVEAKLAPQYGVAIVASMSAFVCGSAIGWSSPAQIPLECGEYSFEINQEYFSWISATITLGAAVICLPMGYFVTMFGEKRCMICLLAPLYVGWLHIIFAKHISMMFIGRFCLGLAAGGYCVTTPLYICEIAQKEIRGKIGGFFQLMITSGILFAYIVGIIPSVLILSIVCFVISLGFGISLLALPESPVYLINLFAETKAIKSLKRLRGAKYNYLPELNQLKLERDERKNNEISLRSVLKRQNTIRSLIISLGLMFFQQMCGINVVIFYSTHINVDSSGKIDKNLATAAVGAIQVFGTGIAVMIIDRFGRRLLLLISGSFLAFTTATVGVYFFFLDQDVDLSAFSWLPLVMLCLFIFMFSIGYGPIPWLMMGELYDIDIKGFGGSLSSTTNWILAFIVTKTFYPMTTVLGTGQTFWVFSVTTIVGIIFIIFCVPETKNKTFTEIQDMLSSPGKWKI